MARDYNAYGSSFVKGVLAKIGNAEKRGQVEALLLNDPEVNGILPEIGQGVFFQSDYSRHMNEIDTQLKDKQQTLDSELDRLKGWWEVNQGALEHYKRLTDEGKLPGTATPAITPAPASTLTMEQVQKLIEERELMAAEYINVASYLGPKHLHEFNEVLNPKQVVEHARSKKLPMDLAYQDLFKEKYEAKAKIASEAQAETFRKEGEERALQRMGATQPYPVRSGADTSPLSVLETQKDGNAGVEAALLEYAKLAAARG